MSSTSMASNSEYGTDSAMQTSISRQGSTVHDLYGLVGVSMPNATEAQIREAYEAMVKKLLPKVPSKAAKAAFSVLTNPATRAQYDRDRLGYLYAQFKSYELFPANLTVDKGDSCEDQIEVYAAVLKNHISDPMEDKKIKIHARLFQIRNELDEYKEKSKNVQEEWATSPNQILRMGANALREVEICARADIEMLENELGDLRGEPPPKNVDGPPGRIASGQYGSDMGAQSKSKSLLAVNQRAPSVPRSPTVPVHLRSASKLGIRVENSSTGDSSSSTARSDSTMAIDDRIQKYLVGSVYSPTFYAPATYLDPVKSQHDVERIIARAKRQSLDPETLSDLAMIKSDKMPKQADKTALSGFNVVAISECDPSIQQKQASYKQYGDVTKTDESSKHLANIGEMPDIANPEFDCEYPNTSNNNMAAQMSTSSDSISSSSFLDQSPPGLGLVEYQKRFGCHVITEDAQENKKKQVSTSNKTSRSAKKKFPKPWVSINDSVSMPAHLSSIRTDLHAGVQSINMNDMESPIERPSRPFQRTSRSSASPRFTPMGKLRAKPALSSISNEILQQELKLAQPLPRKPSENTARTDVIKSVQAAVWDKTQMAKTVSETGELSGTSRKESEMSNEVDVTQETRDYESEGGDAAMQETLERSISRMRTEEAARTLIEMSRSGDRTSQSSQRREFQHVNSQIQNDNTWPSALRRTKGQQLSVLYNGAQSVVPEYGAGSKHNGFPYNYGLYDHTQHYNLDQQPSTSYPTCASLNGRSVIPTIYHRGFQQGYQTGGQVHPPYAERASPYGAIGSEMKAMKEKKAQEAKAAAMDKEAREKNQADMEKPMEKPTQASSLSHSMGDSHKSNDDPFVD